MYDCLLHVRVGNFGLTLHAFVIINHAGSIEIELKPDFGSSKLRLAYFKIVRQVDGLQEQLAIAQLVSAWLNGQLQRVVLVRLHDTLSTRIDLKRPSRILIAYSAKLTLK